MDSMAHVITKNFSSKHLTNFSKNVIIIIIFEIYSKSQTYLKKSALIKQKSSQCVTMCECKVFINYRNTKNEIHGLSYKDLPDETTLKQILLAATESFNKHVDSGCLSCCIENDSTDKYISEEEMANFDIEKKDHKDTANEVFLKLILPGNEKKMKQVYNEFFKLLYLQANGKSYLIF